MVFKEHAPVVGDGGTGIEEANEHLNEGGDEGNERDDKVCQGVGDRSQHLWLIPIQIQQTFTLFQYHNLRGEAGGWRITSLCDARS